MESPREKNSVTGYPGQLSSLMTNWLIHEATSISGGVSNAIEEIARVLADVGRRLRAEYRHAFLHVLALELQESAASRAMTNQNLAASAEGPVGVERLVSGGHPQNRQAKRPKVVRFPGTFDMHGDSALPDLGYSTRNALTETQRRDLLLAAYKAAPGAGGRTGGSEYWSGAGTPQRLKAIAEHLHHLLTYRIDQRASDRTKIDADLDWLKQVLFWSGSGVMWPRKST